MTSTPDQQNDVPAPTPPKEDRKSIPSRPSRQTKHENAAQTDRGARRPSGDSDHGETIQPQPPTTARRPSGETGARSSEINTPRSSEVNSPRSSQINSPQSSQIGTPRSSQISSPRTSQIGTPRKSQIGRSSQIGARGEEEACDSEAEDLDLAEEDVPVYPMSNWEALKTWEHHLSPYEQQEINDYPIVHYFGIPQAKIHATVENSANNHGFCDNKANYKITTGDHLLYRYEILDKLGQGAFGSVMRVTDHLEKRDLAVKVIRNKKRFAHQALMEIKLLQFLKDLDPLKKAHIIHVGANFIFRKHLCICFELLSLTLYDLTRNNGFRGFGLELTRRFTVQILIALRIFKDYNIIHCDLKPENVLLVDATKTNLRIIDFGSACFEEDRTYTYIQSRFYRAPEVILGLPYDPAIDIWSTGCMVAEMVIGLPIFPGENEVDQMACITEVMGVAPTAITSLSRRKKMFFDQIGNPRMKKRQKAPGAKTMASACDCDNHEFVEFMKGCLAWDPAIRLSPNAALNSSWIVQGVQGHELIRRNPDGDTAVDESSPPCSPRESFLPPI